MTDPATTGPTPADDDNQSLFPPPEYHVMVLLVDDQAHGLRGRPPRARQPAGH